MSAKEIVRAAITGALTLVVAVVVRPMLPGGLRVGDSVLAFIGALGLFAALIIALVHGLGTEGDDA